LYLGSKDAHARYGVLKVHRHWMASPRRVPKRKSLTLRASDSLPRARS